MNHLIIETEKAYESMQYRNVIKEGFFEFVANKDDYFINVGS